MLNNFQKLIGRLQNNAIVIPARKSLLRPFNTDLQKIPSAINISLAPELSLTLKYWLILLSNISQRPRCVYKLIPGNPQYTGFTDVSSLGTGGVWTSGTHHLSPSMCSVLFPAEVRNHFFSEKNIKGDIKNLI